MDEKTKEVNKQPEGKKFDRHNKDNKKRPRRVEKPKSDLEDKVIAINRVTKVSVQKEEKENSRVKGYAIIELDGVLKINGIRIIEGNSRMFAAMPNRKISDDKYIDYVYPVNKELREEIERAILEEYNKEN